MNSENTGSSKPMHGPQANRLGTRPSVTAATGLLLAAIGSGVVLQLLLGPPSLKTEAHGTVACVSALGGNSVYDEDDDSITSEWWSGQGDTCERLRRERIAEAIFVAVPTAIAGSVGMTALVFRRQLSGPGREPG